MAASVQKGYDEICFSPRIFGGPTSFPQCRNGFARSVDLRRPSAPHGVAAFARRDVLSSHGTARRSEKQGFVQLTVAQRSSPHVGKSQIINWVDRQGIFAAAIW